MTEVAEGSLGKVPGLPTACQGGQKMTDKKEKKVELISRIGEYEGKPVLSLIEVTDGQETRYPFNFGTKKARMILAKVAEIQEFVRIQESKNAGK